MISREITKLLGPELAMSSSSQENTKISAAAGEQLICIVALTRNINL